MSHHTTQQLKAYTQYSCRWPVLVTCQQNCRGCAECHLPLLCKTVGHLLQAPCSRQSVSSVVLVARSSILSLHRPAKLLLQRMHDQARVGHCRNVHPTSYLLFRANAQHCGVAGFVLVSNISITVLNPDWVDKHHSYRTQLTGLPTCSTELPEGRWLIGDTMGQLYVLHSQDWSIRPAMVEAHGPVVSPPTVMCHLGSWGGRRAVCLS